MDLKICTYCEDEFKENEFKEIAEKLIDSKSKI